jgi:hypothetical protein
MIYHVAFRLSSEWRRMDTATHDTRFYKHADLIELDHATHDTRFYKHADLIELDQASYLYTRKIFNFHCPDMYFIFYFLFSISNCILFFGYLNLSFYFLFLL